MMTTNSTTWLEDHSCSSVDVPLLDKLWAYSTAAREFTRDAVGALARQPPELPPAAYSAQLAVSLLHEEDERVSASK
jgi:hypothetical protein